MANWTDVEFRRTFGRRRLHDAFALAPDILMLWDFLVGLGCGETMRRVWLEAFAASGTGIAQNGTFQVGIVIGSLALALLLRFMTTGQPSFESVPLSSNNAQKHSGASKVAFVGFAVASQAADLPVRPWVVAWLLVFTLIVGATRWKLNVYFARLQKSGAFCENVAIIGRSTARDRLAERITSQAHIIGFCETPVDRKGFLPKEEIEKLQQLGADGQLDSVVLAFETEDTEADVTSFVERLKVLPIQVGICDGGEWKGQDTVELRILAGVPIRILANRPISQRDLLIKTIFDKVGALILMTPLVPLMAMISLAIATTSRGPVIFQQTRQGWCGRQFTMFKFRTMRDTPHSGMRFTQTKRKDPRCTPLGRVLRCTSMDELPQLWNVLCGDMSLVGPRPHAEMLDETDRAGREIIQEYAHRFRVKPGITGWAQIHGARGAISSVEQLRQRVTFDLFYIEHWSLWLDFKIVARTPLCLMGKNVF